MLQIIVDDDSEYISSAVNEQKLLSGVEEPLDEVRHLI